MKAESFFIGPLDDDTKLEINLTLADAKLLHGLLVDRHERAIKTESTRLENLMLYLDDIIRQTAFEEEKNS